MKELGAASDKPEPTDERIAEIWNFSTGGSIVPPDMTAFARAVWSARTVWDFYPRDTFQTRVALWMLSCFGAEVSGDRTERSHRFLEEALELVQAASCTASEAHQLVDYVFGRPVGELSQEVGGVMVTLAALCQAQDVDMHAAGETELARVWTKIDVIRAKHAAKPKYSPLPGAVAPPLVAISEAALPPLPKPRWTPAERTAGFAYSEDQMHAYVLADRAAHALTQGEVLALAAEVKASANLVRSAACNWGSDDPETKRRSASLEIAIDRFAALAGAQAPGAMKWQPIETAPKDGTHVLTWWAGAVRIGWIEGAGQSHDGGDWWNTHERFATRPAEARPTRWMPLPATPGADQ